VNDITIERVRGTRQKLNDFVLETPVWRWQGQEIVDIVGARSEIFLKLELFQHTGSFKPRGALSVMLDLDRAALEQGVTAVSAGNHAIAVAFAARLLGTTAKVVMPKTANPFRVERCRGYGAEVVLVEDVQQAFERVRQIQHEEGRHFVHPFEGPLTALGTATVGAGVLLASGGSGRGDHPDRWWRAVRRDGRGDQAVAAGLRYLRRGAGRRRHHAPQLCRRFASVDRQGAHDCRQPGRADGVALQLRSVPALRGRTGDDRR
jgi:hypothetical protein